MVAEAAPPGEHPAGARAFRSRSLTPIQLEDSDEEGCPETPEADEGGCPETPTPAHGRRRRELRGLLWDGVCDRLGLRYRDFVQQLYARASGDAAEGPASRAPGGGAGQSAGAPAPPAPVVECIEVDDSQGHCPADEAPSGSARPSRPLAAAPAAAEAPDGGGGAGVPCLLPDGPTSSEASPMAVLAAAGIAGSSPVAARAAGARGEARPPARRPDAAAAAQRPAARKTAGAPPADVAAPRAAAGGAPPRARPARGGAEASAAAPVLPPAPPGEAVPAPRRTAPAFAAPPLDLAGLTAPAVAVDWPDAADAPALAAASAAAAAPPPPERGSARIGVYHALAQAMERTGRAETALRLQKVQEKALRETLEQAQAALAGAGADLESARARKLAARAEYQEEVRRWETHQACEAEAEHILQMMEDEDHYEAEQAQEPAAVAAAAGADPGSSQPRSSGEPGGEAPSDTVVESEPAAPDDPYAALAAAVADAEDADAADPPESSGAAARAEGEESRPPSPAGKRRKLEAALDEELRMA